MNTMNYNKLYRTVSAKVMKTEIIEYQLYLQRELYRAEYLSKGNAVEILKEAAKSYWDADLKEIQIPF